MLTAVFTGPDVGEKLVISGTVLNAYAEEAVVVPPGFVSTMSTLPAVCAGVVAFNVAVARAVIVAALPPNVRLLTLSRFAPLMTTEVPPAIEPLAGEIVLNVGADGAV